MVLGVECSFGVVVFGSYSLWTANCVGGRMEHADIYAALPMWRVSLSGCEALCHNQQTTSASVQLAAVAYCAVDEIPCMNADRV